MTKTKTFVRDLSERAAKSFGQGALAVVVLQVGASGLAGDPLDLSAWQGLGVAALGGGLTALGSFATSLLSGLKTGTASASAVVAETAATMTPNGPVITRSVGGRHEPDLSGD